MKLPGKETLRRIVEEFPTLPWDDAELGELVTPRYGIITGFGVPHLRSVICRVLAK